LDQIVAADRKAVDYTRAQYETGVGARIALVEAKNALQTAEATAAGIGLTRAQY
jgi:outer membrane protein TolC